MLFITGITAGERMPIVKADREAVFRTIYRTNHWGGKESKSGEGSSLEATKFIRKELPALLRSLGIKSMLDVPCGDFNWMSRIDLRGIEYTGWDIVIEAIEHNRAHYLETAGRSFEWMDVVVAPVPNVEFIFCRDLLQHLSFAEVFMVLDNFKNSAARWLMVTSYNQTRVNKDIAAGDYRPLNLFIEPFNLPASIFAIDEGGLEKNEPDKAMYLIDLEWWRRA